MLWRLEPKAPLRSDAPVTVERAAPNGQLKNGEAPNDLLESQINVKFIPPAQGQMDPAWVHPPKRCRFQSAASRSWPSRDVALRPLPERLQRDPGATARVVPGSSRVRELQRRGPRQARHAGSRPGAEFGANALRKCLNSADKGHNREPRLAPQSCPIPG